MRDYKLTGRQDYWKIFDKLMNNCFPKINQKL